MVRPPCCEKQNLKKGPWTEEEDAKMLAYVSKHGPGNWTAVPKKAGLRRCGKSCRLRWTNYLGPDIKHESFTPEEEDLIIKMHETIGSRWTLIAQQLPGRTDSDVKNFWNTKLRKKLSEMGIDPVTHRPFSQILADYGTINGTLNQNPRTRIGSLSRDLKHALPLPNSEKDNTFSPINHHLTDDSQIQAIKFTTEASDQVKYETFLPNFCHGPLVLPWSTSSSSSSSSSSSFSSACSAVAQENLEVNFSWCDFLLDEEIFQENQEKHGELEYIFGLSSDAFTSKNTTTISYSENTVAINNEAIQKNDESSSNGFVEAIISREKEMFLGFPAYFDQPICYGSD